MCGIAGIISKNNKDRETIIKDMVEAIYHRGSDEDGYYADEDLALGMRRLSIIDLAGGKQPISSHDGRYQIFFNGEIYNYKELKRELGDYPFKTDSDTEVILAGFIKWGSGVCTCLRGMFAFTIYDKKEKKLFLARDFFGIKPLYYWVPPDVLFKKSSSNSAELANPRTLPASGLRRDGYLLDSATFAFSSELKSFLKIPGFKPVVNDEAFYNYLSFQYNPLEETFLKGVFKLPPAHYMEIDIKNGEMRKERYWQFKFKQNKSLDKENARQKILTTIEDSVKHHMIADVPVGSFLSGGIDSSIIATLVKKHLEAQPPSGSLASVKTFTVGFDTLSEGVEAKETSGPLGTDHREIAVNAEEYFKALPEAVWHFDEPVADPSAIGIYFLAREARKEVKVVLSGEGADELFGGYNIYLAPLARKWIAWLPHSLLSFIANLPFEFRGKNYVTRASSSIEDWYIGNAFVFKPREVAKIWKSKPISRFDLEKLYKESGQVSDSTKMQYIDIHTWLVGDILAKADKMTMAHSLELRVPFLDKEVAKLASTLPDEFKWRGGQTKYLLREAFKSVLPESTRTRKKLGFPTPVKNWFTRDREDLYKTILENSYIKTHLDIEYIEQIIEEHVSHKVDNSRKIYLLLMFALWYNMFIK